MEIAVIEKIKRLPQQTEKSLRDAFSVLMHTEFVSRFFFSTNLPCLICNLSTNIISYLFAKPKNVLRMVKVASSNFVTQIRKAPKVFMPSVLFFLFVIFVPYRKEYLLPWELSTF